VTDSFTIYDSYVKQLIAKEQQVAGLVAERNELQACLIAVTAQYAELQDALRAQKAELDGWLKRALLAEQRLGMQTGVFAGPEDDAAPQDLDG
jgi:hypothetical protein